MGPWSELVYVRPLPVHASPDAVEIELIRFVVDETVKAILAGDAHGIGPMNSSSHLERRRRLQKRTAPVSAPTGAVEGPPPQMPWRFVMAGGYAA